MGYFFLSAALIANTLKGYCGKKTSGYTHNVRQALLANLIRMGLCVLVGVLTVAVQGQLRAMLPSPKLLGISLLGGIATAVLVMTWLIGVKKSAFMLLDVFLMLGVFIPLIADSVLFGEQIRPIQWGGMAVLLMATGILCSYNNSIKQKLTMSGLALLLLCGMANGLADLSQKLFVNYVPQVPVSVFNLYTYLFAALVLAITYALMPRQEAEQKADFGRIAGYIFVMAVCLFANSYCKTLAAQHLDAVILYPLNQGMAMILSTAMSAIVFREKLTAKAAVGIAIAFAGLIMINLL